MKSSENKIKWPLVGNDHIIDFLSKSIKNDNLAGTYIFYGPDNLGKTTIANLFAKTLLCQERKNNLPCGECSSCQRFLINSKEREGAEDIDFGGAHGDLHLIKKEKDKKNISIEQIRELIRKLNLSSFLNSYKIGIIKHANTLSTEAANALLKTLEEPKDKVIVILVTSDIDAILDTIISRSQILKFNPVNSAIIYDYLVKEYGAPRSAAKNFSLLCLGRPALAVKFFQDKEFYNNYQERVNIFLSFFDKDINERFNAIEKLLSMGNTARVLSSGQETAKLASRIIEIWQGLSRDMLLMEFDKKDLIQHEIILDNLLRIKGRLRLGNLLYLQDVLRQANEYIKTNVNPKLVLEQIAISI